MNPLGHATALANCSVINPIAADYKCVGVENVRSCNSDVNATELVAGCSTPIERGTCVCKSSVGTIRHSINCMKMTCDSVCSNALEDVMSASHSLRRSLDPDTQFLSKLGQLARKHVATKKELTKWRDYVDELPADSKDVPAQWCGKGIVMYVQDARDTFLVTTPIFLTAWLGQWARCRRHWQAFSSSGITSLRVCRWRYGSRAFTLHAHTYTRLHTDLAVRGRGHDLQHCDEWCTPETGSHRSCVARRRVPFERQRDVLAEAGCDPGLLFR